MRKKPSSKSQHSSEPALQATVEDINSTPLDQILFLELTEIAIEALSGRRLVLPPDSERCIGENLPGRTLYLTGCPENQMGMAIVGECRRRFGKTKGEKISFSFMMRWFAILEAKTNGVLTEFVRKIDGGEEIHDGIFRAAANCPVNAKGKFDPKEYYKRIREIKIREEAEDQK